ncbi:MAG: transporter [Verrucomicrobia bacterium RIFCSPLOWO2_12_FULL_64_8]|nr:MAG: transporter [Verrucomicrobia bacterium RIFCSPLOWO2_12_FULL_64_8]
MTAGRVQTLRVRTPEGAVFSFELASPVTRLAAWAVDKATVSAAWGLLVVIFRLLELWNNDLARGAAVAGYFVLSTGYAMILEWRWSGQTLGKRLVRLRVVDERGLRLTFAQVVLRNLLRFVDALPAAYLVGGLAALFSRRGQRLGDLAAGTIVVREAVEAAPDWTALQSGKYNSLRPYPHVVARLRQMVTPREARAALQAVLRRDRFEAAARVRLFAELAAHFRATTPIPPEAGEGISDEQFVRNLIGVLYLQGPGSDRPPAPAGAAAGTAEVSFRS